MTDDEIRQLVRNAIARHLGPRPQAPPPVSGPPQTAAIPISFARYAISRAEDDVMCVIEPAFRCNHCGYCQCHGH